MQRQKMTTMTWQWPYGEMTKNLACSTTTNWCLTLVILTWQHTFITKHSFYTHLIFSDIHYLNVPACIQSVLFSTLSHLVATLQISFTISFFLLLFYYYYYASATNIGMSAMNCNLQVIKWACQHWPQSDQGNTSFASVTDNTDMTMTL